MERKLLEQEQIDGELEKLPLEGYDRIKGYSRSLMDEENVKTLEQILLLFQSRWIDFAKHKISNYVIDGHFSERQ